MNALEIRGLTKTYGGRFGARQEALRGVDLTVPQGAGFGLVGPNGAGKTTFIKALLGIVHPTGGELRVLGGRPEDPKIRARIGYLPERLHLPAQDTPLAFLRDLARLKGQRHLATAELGALLERVGLSTALGRRIGGFSKGMRQRLGLASALLGKPELLILDEPTDGIDPMGRVEVREILTGELARGVTLFLNSHLLSETERICDHVGVLDAGRIVLQGRLSELRGGKPAWRVHFGQVPDPGALIAEGFVQQAQELWRIEAPDLPSLNARLDAARRSGALLRSLVQESRDLEAVLADAVAA